MEGNNPTESGRSTVASSTDWGRGAPTVDDVRDAARATQPQGPSLQEMPPARPSRLWLWFVAVLVLQLGIWVAWITIASKNRVAEVPLATRSAR